MRNARPALQTGALFAFCTFLLAPRAAASPSSAELVRQAAAHEAAGENDVAVRRYSEAVAIDPTDGTAYLGLAALRLRLGDARESVVVCDAALTRLPDLVPALLGRARAEWAAHDHAAAERDLLLYIDRTDATPAPAASTVDPLLLLASWYEADRHAPGALAAWRRLLVLARTIPDDALAHRARTTVLALTLLVDAADPATHPATHDATRRGLARMAKRP